jgi:hypothetical protein
MAVKWVLSAAFLLALGSTANAETIVTHETEKYFYKNGEMKKFEGQYENTYHLDPEKNTLVRTRVYDYQTKQIFPDETVYTIQNQLDSHPSNAAKHGNPPILKAYGEPGTDSTEVITIEPEFVHTMTASGGRLIVSRARRLK